MTNRRLTENYKLRVYMDALNDTRNMSMDDWQYRQACSAGEYVCKAAWVSYLEACILAEVAKSLKEAA